MNRNTGSARSTVILITLTLVIIIGGLTLFEDDDVEMPIQEASQQSESRALYIAQTALDRSIKALMANPKWRDGFSDVPFESGTYDVEVTDWMNGGRNDEELPPNYVRIVASSEIDGVTKMVEAVWVNAMSAFQYAYAAGDEVDVENHGEGNVTVLGNLHNNSWDGGEITVHDGATIYGDITSIGDVRVGTGGTETPAVVYGDILANRIELAENGETRRFEDLSEWAEGLDLNCDGDTQDTGLRRGLGSASGTASVTAGGRPLADGETDLRVAGGAAPVSIGASGAGHIVDPRPDFTAFYELTSGLSSYPPPRNHTSSPILGDGLGHYFASAQLFLGWLESQPAVGVMCCRCAGDGRVGPDNGSLCDTCEGSGRDSAVEVAGIFYVDDTVLDLGLMSKNLIVHGTIVVARGNPYKWSKKEIDIPGGSARIDHFPSEGAFVLKGESRMHFTQTYRSDEEEGFYVWSERTLGSGDDEQVLPVPEPEFGHRMREFPAILAPQRIDIEPRKTGFSRDRGDIGHERMTVLQGVIYSEEEIRLHGLGGWDGLNGDGDRDDVVEISSISSFPIIPVGRGRFNVDINNDGVLGSVAVGDNYQGFFNNNGYALPTLIYHEGVLLSRTIRSCEQVLVVHDRRIVSAGVPFGFEVSFGSTTYQGLVYWLERSSN
jgi:hypothetical protein